MYMEERLMEAVGACGNCQLKLGSLCTEKQQDAKALTGTVSSFLCPFAGELQNVPVRVR